MLTDPGRGIGPSMNQFIAGVEFLEPDEVIELADGDEFTVAGIDLVVDHTPGHTQGSVVLRTEIATRRARSRWR